MAEDVLEDQSCPGFDNVASADASHIRIGTLVIPTGGSARQAPCIADEYTPNHSIFSPKTQVKTLNLIYTTNRAYTL